MNKFRNSENAPEEIRSNEPEKPPEKLIGPEPHLRGILKTLRILEPEERPDGEIENWKDLYEKVKPYHTMYEFTENVREAVCDYLIKKIPKLKEAVPSIEDLNEEKLLHALAHNWFSELEEIGGQRREVLLTVAAHVVKRIETLAEKKLLGEADPKKLGELGIDPSLRDLIVDLLDASAKADPLFVRFLAYSQLSGNPPEAATPTGLHLPGDLKTHTIAELFPHEAKFIAQRFTAIIEKDAAWKKRPGGDAMARYIEVLKRFYESKNTEEAARIQDEINRGYAEVVATDFPIILGASGTGYYKEPYLDPEFKVSIATAEANRETKDFARARDIMADNLGVIGAAAFAGNVRKMGVKSSIILGGFGANLTFNAAAEEDPVYSLFLDEEIRRYDRLFPAYRNVIEGADKVFSGMPEKANIDYLEKMSRTETMLHEFSHPVHPSETEQGRRLGRRPLTIIDEVKAEIVWRALIPDMLEDGFFGDKEQWAAATLMGLVMCLKNEPDVYIKAEVYNLNSLFEQGIVEFKNGKLAIQNVDAYYAAEKRLAAEVLALYDDETMTERKAAAWVKKRCAPSEASQEFISFVKSLPY